MPCHPIGVGTPRNIVNFIGGECLANHSFDEIMKFGVLDVGLK